MAITSKEINLDQLSVELGNKGLIANFNNPKAKIILPAQGVNISEKELESAIEAHIAQPDQMQITKLNRQQGMIKLQELGFTEEQIKALFTA